jgi:iron complex transport system substrate-binding protein
VFSLNAGQQLVGVCTYCDYPPAAARCEKVGTFTAVSLERLARLQPAVVLLVNGQEPLASLLRRRNYNVLVLDNSSLSRMSNNLRRIGSFTGGSGTAERMARSFERSLASLRSLMASASERPAVFYCVWTQPLLTVGAGSFLDETIRVCGGYNIAGKLAGSYPHFSLERLVMVDPDVIVLPYEARGQTFLTSKIWRSLKAVKNNRLFFLPEPRDDHLARPTLRVIEGLRWLAARLHPELSDRVEAWYEQARRSLK